MSVGRARTHGTQPCPKQLPTEHPLPRRPLPGDSVTLRHHRLAPDAPARASSGRPQKLPSESSSKRDNSSGESLGTGASDANRWFDQSNQHAIAASGNTMDCDPPFFQKESDSSNDEVKPYYNFARRPAAPPRLTAARSSSGDDYRSVIDDLTVEIQNLKEELKRYKQKGPDMLRKEQLFEIKIHGLPRKKRRELETTLQKFAAGLEGSTEPPSSQRQQSTRHNLDPMDSAMSKHASSASGSNARPVDSAYASMSTGAVSSGAPLSRSPIKSHQTKSADQKVESYLRDIPAGLYHRHTMVTEKDKKKLVVRRLEQLFTGKMNGLDGRSSQLQIAPVMVEAQSQQPPMLHQPPSLCTAEPAREARILSGDQLTKRQAMTNQARNSDSGSTSYFDQTGSGGNGNTDSPGTNPSPSVPSPPEQRPTRPKDLDPDRVQNVTENMEYIRHLAVAPQELPANARRSPRDLHPDADGWVYLNLLCNLAQLHIINVTPDFVRSSVSEISTKFQMSPDGHKIRWCGGIEGTRFSTSPDIEGDIQNENMRKRLKMGHSGGGEDVQLGTLDNKSSQVRPLLLVSSNSFHYKPLLRHRSSSKGGTSTDDAGSSYGRAEDSNFGESRWDFSGSAGAGNRRKRRRDGAIIYYSGAPFCTDLSGDPGNLSPTADRISDEQEKEELPTTHVRPPLAFRSASGSSLPYRPLREPVPPLQAASMMDVDTGVPTLALGLEDESSIDMDLTWTDEQQYIDVHPLEPCGLGGVLPDDHFMVVVTTNRPRQETQTQVPYDLRHKSEEVYESINRRLVTLATPTSMPPALRAPLRSTTPPVEIEYVSGRIKRLAPVALPPPAMFYPPFSADSSSEDGTGLGSADDDDDDDDDGSASSGGFVSRQANPQHQSEDYPDGVDLSSGDEDGEDPDEEADARWMYARQKQDVERGALDVKGKLLNRWQSSGSVSPLPGTAQGRKSCLGPEVMLTAGIDGCSAATAGGAASCGEGSGR